MARRITEMYGRLVNLDVAPGFSAVAPVVASDPVGALTGQHYPDSLIHPDKRGIRAARRDRVAAASRVVAGDSRGLRRLLQHIGVSDDRDADGAAVPAFEKPQRAEQRRRSADAGQWIQRVSRDHAQYICYRSELSSRLCAELAALGAARSARLAANDGDVSRHQRHARNAGISAEYLSSRARSIRVPRALPDMRI